MNIKKPCRNVNSTLNIYKPTPSINYPARSILPCLLPPDKSMLKDNSTAARKQGSTSLNSSRRIRCLVSEHLLFDLPPTIPILLIELLALAHLRGVLGSQLVHVDLLDGFHEVHAIVFTRNSVELHGMADLINVGVVPHPC